jgi:hypothetical protein
MYGRDGFWLARTDPPLIGQKYGLGEKDVESVVLGPRFAGESLEHIDAWPFFVRVWRALIAIDERGELNRDEVEMIAWAELYKTLEDAIRLRV